MTNGLAGVEYENGAKDSMKTKMISVCFNDIPYFNNYIFTGNNHSWQKNTMIKILMYLLLLMPLQFNVNIWQGNLV